MTDIEQLKLAAKAADYGFVYKRRISNDAHEWTSEDGMLWQWNPLLDDGQALRLAVKLGVEIYVYESSTEAVAVKNIEAGTAVGFEIPHNNDPYKATRRAIVKAASHIGKSL